MFVELAGTQYVLATQDLCVKVRVRNAEKPSEASRFQVLQLIATRHFGLICWSCANVGTCTYRLDPGECTLRKQHTRHCLQSVADRRGVHQEELPFDVRTCTDPFMQRFVRNKHHKINQSFQALYIFAAEWSW